MLISKSLIVTMLVFCKAPNSINGGWIFAPRGQLPSRGMGNQDVDLLYMTYTAHAKAINEMIECAIFCAQPIP